MWICNHCHTENKDGYSSCVQCGATRSAGRFGSAPTVLNARQSAPASVPGAQPLHRYQENPAPARRPLPPPVCMQGLGKVVGWLLLVLLPVLAGLFAWRQYDALSAALVPLLLDAAAPEWARLAAYIGLALVALLLCTLPGLHTLMRCQRRPRRAKKEKE